MDKATQKAIEAAGCRVATVKDFLGLSEEENQIVELRVALALHIRALRSKSQLTQRQLAARLKSSQSRVAKIESPDAGVSLDLMFRGFFAVGGRIADLAEVRPKKPKSAVAKRS
jgi:DNA-binding transcriptional regulator YiaG